MIPLDHFSEEPGCRAGLSKKARNKHEELNRKLYISKDGYMEAFLVNETSENVWFDQFRIETTTPVILQETHYDPWGVELQGLGYQEPGSKVNKYLYNGKEFNDHVGLNLFDYGARLYDAAVGRWFTVDPLAELPSQIAHSPYVYAWNNPVGMIDPTGMAAEECKGCPEPKDGDPGAGTGYGGITVTASRIYDLPDFSSVQKSNQNAQAGWGGGGNSGGSGDYKSPNIEAANRYFNPNRPPSSGAISPDYTIEGASVPIFKILKALKIPGIQSWFKGILGKTGTNLLKPLGLGSTGRTAAVNLAEQLAMKEALSNPAAGKVILQGLKDSRWAGWSKMQYTHTGLDGSKIVIHYVGKFENGVLKYVDDFKFK